MTFLRRVVDFQNQFSRLSFRGKTKHKFYHNEIVHFASLSVSVMRLARLESNPFLIVGQNGNFRLHLDVVKGRIVMSGQVVCVVVVINRFVLLRLIAELLYVGGEVEHFALVGNRLYIVFVFVG